MTAAASKKLSPDETLVKEITDKETTGDVTRTVLATDDRVLARVTDGIYREPAAALRELIANAYDADATKVWIQTDAPRFGRITVRDNGLGMNKVELVHLINHIGGSAKRTREGAQMGVSKPDDPSRSHSGRRLIGKIGIGLFSVSQLTRHFRITTKKRGAKFRLVAAVKLYTYNEDSLAENVPSKDRITTGTVSIQSVRAEDIDYQGTELELFELQPAARDLLQSRDIWDRVNAGDDLESDLVPEKFHPPSYHCGRLDPETNNMISDSAVLPWEPGDDPYVRFAKLHEAVLSEPSKRSKPNLQQTLDRYLRTIWLLSLSAPLPYLGAHPFDLGRDADPVPYLISNDKKGSAQAIKLKRGETVRDRLRLRAGTPSLKGPLPFEVFFDEVGLRRPLCFKDLPGSKLDDARKRPMIFYGKCKPPVNKMPEEVAGGRELEFEAYFLWTPKVIPTEHNGVLIRIADASGTLFDSTFFGYQIAETTRLSQISAEIFVTAGLEAALNIDRESFNFGHPHAKIVTSWIHRALRQLATTQKRVVKEVRDKEREEDAKKQASKVRRIVAKRLGTTVSELPDVEFVENDGQARDKRKKDVLAYERDAVFAGVAEPKNSAKARQDRKHFEEQLGAIMQILDAYGLLRDVSYARQEEILNAIATVLAPEESDE